ncbi:hypothetical protein J6590_056482 [Homalodisca vitripennis]|nr:hypothetical protein J6590_056482 [Homalodisca vitripennis]
MWWCKLDETNQSRQRPCDSFILGGVGSQGRATDYTAKNQFEVDSGSWEPDKRGGDIH